MLAADKLLLQSNLKQRSIELREKELKLFNTNFSAVGTQAAIMAGFTLTSFVEIDLPPEKHIAKLMLHFCVALSICVNFLCVAMVTFVTVFGSGKALRGQDGSMDFAVDEMNRERPFIVRAQALSHQRALAPSRLANLSSQRHPYTRPRTRRRACAVATCAALGDWGAREEARGSRSAPYPPIMPRTPPPTTLTTCAPTRQFMCFGVGVVATLGCLFSAAWVLMEKEVAALASCLVLGTMYLVVSEARRIRARFYMEVEETVSFNDLSTAFPSFSPERTHSASALARSQSDNDIDALQAKDR